MAGGCDEVEQDVDTVVAESGVTLDTRLLGQNVIVLALEVANNLAKAASPCQYRGIDALHVFGARHLDSLSTWSPNPGVSTTVREMRVPSSSSSSSADVNELDASGGAAEYSYQQ
jgi:hypothetical protein